MERFIQARRAEISELCRKHHVQRLELFGSAVKGDFDSRLSDLDFLVEFQSDAARGFSGDYFALKFEHEELLGREVDLVMARAVRNPFFLQAIADSRTLMYAA